MFLGVCFECVWFVLGFIRTTTYGTFGEVEVHTGQGCKLLKYMYLWLDCMNVVRC